MGKNLKAYPHIHPSVFMLGTLDNFYKDRIYIGKYVVVGANSAILTHGPIRPYKENNQIHIGEYSWIGYDTTILSGANIGRTCIIGAKSLVIDTITPYSIACGNPAKFLKFRDGNEIIRSFVVKWLMNKGMGSVPIKNVQWNLITKEQIKDLFGLPRQPIDENDPIVPVYENFEQLTIQEIFKIYDIQLNSF